MWSHCKKLWFSKYLGRYYWAHSVGNLNVTALRHYGLDKNQNNWNESANFRFNSRIINFNDKKFIDEKKITTALVFETFVIWCDTSLLSYHWGFTIFFTIFLHWFYFSKPRIKYILSVGTYLRQVKLPVHNAHIF